MKKIFIIFMVFLLLCLTIVPSFAIYSASLEVDDNDTDTGSVDVNLHSANFFDATSYDDSQHSNVTNTGEDYLLISSYAAFAGTFSEVFPFASIGDTLYFYIKTTNEDETFASSFIYLGYGRQVFNAGVVTVSSDTVLNTNVYFYPRSTSADATTGYLYLMVSYVPLTNITESDFTYFDYSLSLSEFVDTQSELYTPLNDLYFSQDVINNRGVYLQAFSDSNLTTDITSDVATSSGLAVDSDGLLYLEFEDGETDQLFYDGTVYYQVTLDPSPPFMFVNLYRHIFENFSGTYTFLTEDNWIFITCVSSIAICFVIFVGVFFFKRFSH